jgi:hypothetical protein
MPGSPEKPLFGFFLLLPPRSAGVTSSAQIQTLGWAGQRKNDEAYGWNLVFLEINPLLPGKKKFSAEFRLRR